MVMDASRAGLLISPYGYWVLETSKGQEIKKKKKRVESRNNLQNGGLNGIVLNHS